MFKRILGGLLLVILVAGGVAFALSWRSEIDEIEPPVREAFDQELIQRGAQLAAVGNCIACHTMPGSKAFAGGFPIPTPFGTIYSTNITPDPETGIGRWSEAAFQRAMREGVDRAGNHLYPAFPYDHYTRVTEEDNRALYAFLMTREPVEAEAPENELPFPYSFRPILAGWKLLYLDEGVYQPDPNESEEWNRGAYLSLGLGHCGACHTPRNDMGGLQTERHFDGGEAEGWQAYAINEDSVAPVPWNRESLFYYLRHGWHAEHGVSRGPMAEVTGNLGLLPDEDVQAIATYVASVMGEPTPDRVQQAQALIEEVQAEMAVASTTSDSQTVPAPEQPQGDGAAIYAAACSVCHNGRRDLPYGGLPFQLSTAVNAPSPQNIINVVLFGLPPAHGEASSVMPGFADVLTNEQLTALLNYMREEFTDREAWEGVTELVARTRSGEYKVNIFPSDGIERGPENVGAEN